MKIAVMGSAASSVNRAPFKNAAYHEWTQGKREYIQQAHDSVPGDWDIWGCSPGCYGVVPRATRWFEVHRWEAGVPWFSPEYTEFLRRFEGPVYTGGVVPEIKNHVVYPIDYIEEKFSSYFLTSSLALMVALAIDTIEQMRLARQKHRANLVRLDAGIPAPMDGSHGSTIPPNMGIEQFEAELEKDDSDDVIGLWGVDMAAAEEYAYQRPGCQFFVLEAMRRGIGVYLPPESDLMRPQPVYGISEWDHNYIKLTSRARELNLRLQELQKQAAEAAQNMPGVQGEMHALQSFVMTWTSPYGMLPGMVIRQAEGTGLGSGITQFDGRPVSRMNVAPPAAAAVVDAMSEGPVEQLGRQLIARVEAFRKDVGASDVTSTDQLLEMLVSQSQLARQHSAILQPFMKQGESTGEMLLRLLTPAAPKKAKRTKTKARRR